jgi:hypothetical protein
MTCAGIAGRDGLPLYLPNCITHDVSFTQPLMVSIFAEDRPRALPIIDTRESEGAFVSLMYDREGMVF